MCMTYDILFVLRSKEELLFAFRRNGQRIQLAGDSNRGI